MKLRPLLLLLLSFLILVPLVAFSDEAEKTDAPPPVRPGGIRYVALLVDDMKTMTDFFEKDLGFRGEGAETFMIFEVAPAQYFVLVPREEAKTQPGNMVVGFNVEEIDTYFEQVTSHGLTAIDPMKGDKVLTRPVYRQWGAREFGVKTPEGDILVFTRMPKP